MNRREFITGAAALAAMASLPKGAQAARNFVRASSQALHNATAIVTTEPFSVSMWAKVATTSDAFQVLFSAIDNTASGFGFFIQVLGTGSGSTVGTVRARAEGSGGTGNAVSSNQMTAGVWSHIAAVFSASNSRSIYLDGTKVTNGTSRGAITVSETNFGYFNATFGDYLNGDIAFPAIWASALTDAEVASLAAGYSPRHVRANGLLGFRPLTNGLSPEPSLLGGNAMSLTGSPTVSTNPRVYY
jgi:hypothetical protein